MQDEHPDHQECVQRGHRLPPVRRPDGEPLPQPLRADQEGPDDQEHQTLSQGAGEGKQPAGREGREWEIHISRYLLDLSFKNACVFIYPTS